MSNSSEAITSWKEKSLHGKYPVQLTSNTIDKPLSTTYLQKGYLYPATEGFIQAIQDKVIRTKNYEKHILKINVNDVCRKCGLAGENIEHVTGGCPALANTDYLSRHNQVAKIVHRHLALKYKLVSKTDPYYKYLPPAVLESGECTLYWDRPVITDKTVDHNRPDILLINKKEKKAIIVDIAVPLTQNVRKAEQEKLIKYQNLAFEIKRIWKLGEVQIIPIVISVEGVITTRLKPFSDQLGLPKGLLTLSQKAVILQTCHLVRKFLSA